MRNDGRTYSLCFLLSYFIFLVAFAFSADFIYQITKFFTHTHTHVHKGYLGLSCFTDPLLNSQLRIRVYFPLSLFLRVLHLLGRKRNSRFLFHSRRKRKEGSELKCWEYPEVNTVAISILDKRVKVTYSNREKLDVLFSSLLLVQHFKTQALDPLPTLVSVSPTF